MSRSPSRDRSGSRAAGRTNGATSGGGSSDTGPAPVIASVAGSSQVNTDNAVSQSIDGNDYNRWLSSTTTGTLTFTLTTPAVCVGYRITTPHSGTNQSPKDWTFQGSPDNSAWTTLDTRTNVTTWIAAASPSFTVANTTSYGYYRIVVTANNGGSLLGVGEVRLTPASGIMTYGGNGGTMVEWWDAGTITGKSDGATIAASDLVDQSSTHNFSGIAGASVTYRATGGPNSKPCLESLSSGSGLDISGNRVNPTGDVTIFAVFTTASTANQQIFGGGNGGAAIDVNANKFRMMKQTTAQLAVSTTNHPTSAWCIVIVTYVSATGATKFRIITTGSDVTDTVAGSAGTFTETVTHVGWGSQDGTTNAAFRGSIAEMGRYASVLDATDLPALGTVLKTKYGL